MDDLDPDNPFPEPVEIEITDVFDLHTIPPRDVKAVVEEYLRLAHEKGFRCVRIIHGKGIGVQREMVRSINEIGHLTGKQTIAEFAENVEIIEMLRSLGVDYAQGYWLCRPQPLVHDI